MTGAIIEARELAKSFGGVNAVAGISLSIPRGTIVGLLGLNGAGKSTLMRLLTGVLRPDSGTALISGRDVHREPRVAKSNVGFLPEAATGFSNLTVREFLTFAAQGRGMVGTSVPAAVASAAVKLELKSALDRVLGTLSKGWRQRAWLAQAMIHDPVALILDEPTDGLDPTQKSELRAFLRSAAASKAILMSTHILEEAEAVCDRLIVVTAGRVAADTDTAALASTDGRLGQAFARLTAAV